MSTATRPEYPAPGTVRVRIRQKPPAFRKVPRKSLRIRFHFRRSHPKSVYRRSNTNNRHLPEPYRLVHHRLSAEPQTHRHVSSVHHKYRIFFVSRDRPILHWLHSTAGISLLPKSHSDSNRDDICKPTFDRLFLYLPDLHFYQRLIFCNNQYMAYR